MPWLYDNPKTMDYNNLDQPIRVLCKKINESTWLRTEESCAGHYTNEPSSSGWNSRDLYLRLVLITGEIGYLLKMVDEIRKSCLGLQWTCSLVYDRRDELGTHWFFKLNYGRDICNRDIAIELITRKFLSITRKEKEEKGKPT